MDINFPLRLNKRQEIERSGGLWHRVPGHCIGAAACMCESVRMCVSPVACVLGRVCLWETVAVCECMCVCEDGLG